MVPGWLLVVVPIVAYIIGAFTKPVVDLINANTNAKTARLTAQATDATTRRGQDIAKSQSDRDAIKQAVELIRSKEAQDQRIGYAWLEGLAQMEGLSKDDALQIQALMRPKTEELLSQAREAIAGGDTVVFELNMGPSGDEGGSDDDDSSDQR